MRYGDAPVDAAQTVCIMCDREFVPSGKVLQVTMPDSSEVVGYLCPDCYPKSASMKHADITTKCFVKAIEIRSKESGESNLAEKLERCGQVMPTRAISDGALISSSEQPLWDQAARIYSPH